MSHLPTPASLIPKTHKLGLKKEITESGELMSCFQVKADKTEAKQGKTPKK